MNFTLNLFCLYLLAFLCHMGPGPDLPCCRFEWGLLRCCQPVEPLTTFKGGSKYDPALQERRCGLPMALPAVCPHRDRTRNWGPSAPTASGAPAGRAASPQPSRQDLRAPIVVVLVLSVTAASGMPTGQGRFHQQMAAPEAGSLGRWKCPPGTSED